MSKGYILLHRQIQDNWIWLGNSPFDERSAWVDLLLFANRFDKVTNRYGQPTLVRQGEFLTSIEKLSERWGWSRNRTKRFLKKLENCEMIETIRTNKWTSVRITNYAHFQGISDSGKTISGLAVEPTCEPPDEPTPEPPDGLPDEPQLIKIKNDKERKKDKSNSAFDPNANNVTNLLNILNHKEHAETDYLRENRELYVHIKDWCDYKDHLAPKSQNHYTTQRGLCTFISIAVRNAKEHGVERVCNVIDEAIASGWKGVVWENLLKRGRKKQSATDAIDAW